MVNKVYKELLSPRGEKMGTDSRLGIGLKGINVFFKDPEAVPVLNRKKDLTLPEHGYTEENDFSARSVLPDDNTKIVFINMDHIITNSDQPRKNFDEERLRELADSIRTAGVLQPILVRRIPENDFEIIAGERRYRAALMAGLEEIPAIIYDMDYEQVFEIALIENLQRENLDPIEEASSYYRLVEKYGYTQAEVGKIVHKSRSHIANVMRIMTLPDEVQKMVSDGILPYTAARALVGSEDPMAAAIALVEGGLSVRDAEDNARASKKRAKNNSKGSDGLHVSDGMKKTLGEMAEFGTESNGVPEEADIDGIRSMLSNNLGIKVDIKGRNSKGKIILHFDSNDEFDAIVSVLSSIN